MLDIDEWALSQHLSKFEFVCFRNSFIDLLFCLIVKVKLDGHELPNTLPDHLVPPSKRHLSNNGSPSGGLYPAIGGEQNTQDDS